MSCSVLSPGGIHSRSAACARPLSLAVSRAGSGAICADRVRSWSRSVDVSGSCIHRWVVRSSRCSCERRTRWRHRAVSESRVRDGASCESARLTVVSRRFALSHGDLELVGERSAVDDHPEKILRAQLYSIYDQQHIVTLRVAQWCPAHTRRVFAAQLPTLIANVWGWPAREHCSYLHIVMRRRHSWTCRTS